jgi:hypothetical protein
MSHLKEHCQEIFCFSFFYESPSPKPLKITLGSSRIFKKFSEIFASQGASKVSMTPVEILPLVSTTPVANNGNNMRLLTPKSEL